MNPYKIIRTHPKDADFHLFTGVLDAVYSKDSPRFVMGFEPVLVHLEACYVLLENSKPIGRFAFYENSDLKYHNKTTASIGSYECIADDDASNVLLLYAKNLAKQKKYEFLIGPMEGSTWSNYRFSNSNEYPNFFMEPFHEINYNTHFTNNGFKTIAKYISNIDETLFVETEKLSKFEKYFTEKGAFFRRINLENLESDLSKIGNLSNQAFSSNFLFTPIAVPNFVNKYKAIAHLFNPDLTWLVENEVGELQAFIFAIKDYNDTSGETLIIKSMARLQTSNYKGIGSYLAAKVIQIAKEKGYKRMIHAFMIEDNNSVEVSEKYKIKTFKKYTLYGQEL